MDNIASDATAAALQGRSRTDLEGVRSGRGYLGRAFAWAAEYTNAAARHAAAMQPTLRIATLEDVSVVMRFIRELAEFEREPDAVKTSEATMLRDGFGDEPQFLVMLAEDPPTTPGGPRVPVAMAFCFPVYSTWEGRSLYLEDLYVPPAHRRRGISKLLFTALARAAEISLCVRLQWSVLRWNEPAVLAYQALAAVHLHEWDIYRLYADGIHRVADWGAGAAAADEKGGSSTAGTAPS